MLAENGGSKPAYAVKLQVPVCCTAMCKYNVYKCNVYISSPASKTNVQALQREQDVKLDQNYSELEYKSGSSPTRVADNAQNLIV